MSPILRKLSRLSPQRRAEMAELFRLLADVLVDEPQQFVPPAQAVKMISIPISAETLRRYARTGRFTEGIHYHVKQDGDRPTYGFDPAACQDYLEGRGSRRYQIGA